MEIAFLGDCHLGYPRFKEDSFLQAERALKKAEELADVIIITGDFFDAKVPSLDTLSKAVDILKDIKKPIYAIHGNHERRSKGSINALQLLDSMGLIHYMHGKTITIEKLKITLLGNVPEGYVKAALEKIEKEGDVLVIHQDIKEIVGGESAELRLEDILSLPYRLVVNGHIHHKGEYLKGKLILPGSTVLTQLKKEETAPKGFYLVNGENLNYRFVEIPTRPFFFVEMKFDKASPGDIIESVRKKAKEIKENEPTALVRVRVIGTLKEGIKTSDFTFPKMENVYVDNRLDSENLVEKIEKIREMRKEKTSVDTLALGKINEALKDKVGFKPSEMFLLLSEGKIEEAERLLGVENE